MKSYWQDEPVLDTHSSRISTFTSRCPSRQSRRNGCLVSQALALVRVEVETFLACADDTLAVNAANGFGALDEGAVLALANAQAAAA